MKSRLIPVIFISLFALTGLTVLSDRVIVLAEPTPNAIRIVHAGEGNSTNIVLAFLPQEIEIKAGESIMWDSPTVIAEPHSVTFMKDNESFADSIAPFIVSNSTDISPVIPNSNAEPLIVPSPPGAPSQSKAMLGVNSRAYLPVVIDSTGQNVTYLPPNSNYTIDGTEKYVNSGWLWPEGQAPPGGPSLTKFTVTFEKPGKYDYLCNVHPWMTGTVIVR